MTQGEILILKRAEIENFAIVAEQRVDHVVGRLTRRSAHGGLPSMSLGARQLIL